MPKLKSPSAKDMLQLENWLIYGIDVVHRRISFGTLAHGSDEEDGFTNEFNENNVNLVIRAIDKMMDISNNPIEIHMSSYGGYVDDMLALMDKIQETKCQFKFYGRGKIMSAATWVMVVCDERRLAENTQIMFHHGSQGAGGNTTDFEITAKYLERLRRKSVEVFAKNSWIKDVDTWDSLLTRDLYLNPERAIKLGLADEIIPYAKRGNYRKGCRAKTFGTAPDKRAISNIIRQMFKDIKAPTKLTVEVSAPKEEFENVRPYDNTEAEFGKDVAGQIKAEQADSETPEPDGQS